LHIAKAQKENEMKVGEAYIERGTSILVVAGQAKFVMPGTSKAKFSTAHKNIMYEIKLSGVENVASCT
jgi:hypothetical protein